MAEFLPVRTEAIGGPNPDFGPWAAPSAADDGLHLKSTLIVLRRHKWIVLAAALGGLLLAGIHLYRQPPAYRAVATVRLSDVRRSLTAGIASDDAQIATFNPLFSEIQVLQSRRTLGAVVDELGSRLVLPARGPAPMASQAMSREAAIDQLRSGLRVTSRQNTNVLDITFTARDPVLAQTVANSIASVYQRQNALAAQQQSRLRRVFIESQLTNTDSILATAQERLSSFRRRQEAYSSRDRFTAQQTGLFGLDMRLQELDADRRIYSSLLASVQSGSRVSEAELRAVVASPGIADNPVVAPLYSQLVEYQHARDTLTSGIFGSSRNSPDVQRLDALIATTKERIVAAVRSQVEALTARITALRDLRATSAAAIRELPAVESEEVWLTQEVATVRGLAERLRDEHQRARIAEAVAMGQVEIVDVATPGSPVPTGGARILLLGALAGLLGGVGAAFGIERLNTSIRRRDDIEGVLGIANLAVIPQFAAATQLDRRGIRKLPLARTRAVPLPKVTELVTVGNLASSASEAYRTLRTNIIFSQVTQTIRRLVVTSPGAGEGKTTTAANLAVAFAQQGMRVLFIDCDLRRSRAHKVFGIPRSPGVAELVVGLATIDEVSHPTAVPTLFVIPGGTSPPHPAELLGGTQMKAVLDRLAERYDLIILDTPPVLASADASVISAAADGVVLVVRAGATERAAALEAVQQLVGVGGRVVGCVLNDADAAMVRYGTPHYYGTYSTPDRPVA